ncbi:MAG: GNAT family N-acetyltransferase [Leadbetterella sp.]|nr:GNAT family N-acetyltransferase [Leadbetterella sp.]
MKIRDMQEDDTTAVANLLQQLGYEGAADFLPGKIHSFITDPDEYCLVAEETRGQVIGFISIHIIPQIALKGDFARISYFSVDEHFRSRGVGKLLEEYGEKIARERNCDRIELHSHSRREDAHRFYYRQGYVESPKYLVKKLF